MNQQLQAFDFSSVINTASLAIKDNLPSLIQSGVQKRVAEINAARAQKIAAAATRTAAAQAPAAPVPATMAAPSQLPAPTTRGFLQTLPAWVIPAVIALVVAFIKLNGNRKK